jgi:hypothetical protein
MLPDLSRLLAGFASKAKNELKIDCFRRKKVNKASAKPAFEAKLLLAHPFS